MLALSYLAITALAPTQSKPHMFSLVCVDCEPRKEWIEGVAARPGRPTPTLFMIRPRLQSTGKADQRASLIFYISRL